MIIDSMNENNYSNKNTCDEVDCFLQARNYEMMTEGIKYEILQNTAGIDRRWIDFKMTKSDRKEED